jgi:sec-independent protein translocase protein TatA
VLANLFGMDDIWVVLIAIVVLFGGSQLPKLARNAGEAMKEFRKGHAEASGISAQPSSAGAGGGATAPVALPSAPAQPQQATGGAAGGEDHVTLTRSELDALLADREARARAGKQDHQGPEN